MFGASMDWDLNAIVRKTPRTREENMTRIYVGNISFNSSEESLRGAFSQFGRADEVKLVMDRETGRPRGFAFVCMTDTEAARRAIAALDGTMLDGRSLRVSEAAERNSGGHSGGGARMGGGGRRW